MDLAKMGPYPEPQERIAELEAAYEKAQAETDDLYCLYTTGMHKDELSETGPSPLDIMNKWAHWPEPGKPWTLPK